MVLPEVYLVDSSGLWRIHRDDRVRGRWQAAIEAGELLSCGPQRVEFCRSARNLTEFEQMSRDLAAFYPDAAVPTGIWRWIDATQHVLVRAGSLRAFSIVDLLVCGVAALHGLEILHDDGDFVLAARHLSDVRQRRV